MMAQDLDQGGSYREWIKVNLGPSLGWYNFQWNNFLSVTTGGTTIIPVGTVFVYCFVPGVAGPPILQLPSAIPVSAIPASLLGVAVTIIDMGGFALSNPITILPKAGESIMGLASYIIPNNYGAVALLPNITQGGWTQQ